MRDFVIKSLDVLIWIVGGLIALAGIAGGLFFLVNGQMQGLLFMVLGPIYAILFCGMFLLASGVYTNTRRTAEALEKLASR
jgi:hypothetical protein